MPDAFHVADRFDGILSGIADSSRRALLRRIGWASSVIGEREVSNFHPRPQSWGFLLSCTSQGSLLQEALNSSNVVKQCAATAFGAGVGFKSWQVLEPLLEWRPAVCGLDELRNHLFLDDVQRCHSCCCHRLMNLPGGVCGFGQAWKSRVERCAAYRRANVSLCNGLHVMSIGGVHTCVKLSGNGAPWSDSLRLHLPVFIGRMAKNFAVSAEDTRPW